MNHQIRLVLCLLTILQTASAQTNVGAYFTFQSSMMDSGTNAATYNTNVSASSLPGSSLFSATGSGLTNFQNFGSAFTAFDGSEWLPGRCATWNANTGSTNNSWQVTFSSTDISDLSVRFKYRLNAVKSGGALVTGFSTFQYRIGSGSFSNVPAAPLALTNNTNYDNIWTADLSALAAIEDQSSVTLKWSLPDFDANNPTQLRIDDLQITGVNSAVPPPPPITRTRFLPTGNYNVLFVSFDDLKANFGPFVTPELAAAMPMPVTPHLDTVSSTGMSFTRAYCQQAVCWASRTSLLTGCRPDTTKVWDDGIKFRDTMPGVITLPQHFANRGYSVAGYGKIFDSRNTPANQDATLSWPDGQSDPSVSFTNSGTAHTFYEDGHWQAEQAAPTGSAARQILFATDAAVTNFWATPNRPVDANLDYADGMTATAGINKLNTFATSYLNTGKPFFLAVGFKKPHLPFTCPKTFWDLYDPNEINLAGYTGTRTLPTGTLPFTAATSEIGSYQDLGGANPVSPADARRLIHGYLAATSFADYQLGRVLAALNASGVANNTIIVVWGDHGWHLGDHNGFWAKHSCYEDAARAPLIIRAPGMSTLGTAGKTCRTPVEFVDIFPTLVDLASLPAPAQPAGLEPQGISLRTLLEDPAQPWKKAAFSQYQRNISGSGVTNPGNGMGYTIRTSRFRFTEWWRTQSDLDGNGDSLNRDVKLHGTPEHVELYDLITDPKATINLASNPAYAGLVNELSTALAGGYGWSTAQVQPPADFPTTFTTWQSSLVEPGHPLAGFDELLDPDGDGISNLMEYAMGSDPLHRDTNLPWSGVVDTNGTKHLVLEYPLVGARTDVITQAKKSTTLTDWSTSGVTNENLGTKANQTNWRSKILIESPPSPAGFLRLESGY